MILFGMIGYVLLQFAIGIWVSRRVKNETDYILAGRSLLWMAWNGRTVESAAATILINSEIGKVCIITACGGSDMKRWLPLIDQIEAYARREGCKRVRIYGRRGWLHVLEGFEEKHVIMDKELG